MYFILFVFTCTRGSVETEFAHAVHNPLLLEKKIICAVCVKVCVKACVKVCSNVCGKEGV